MNSLPSATKVVVIGGGVVGCSVAYHLAKFGWKDTILFERDQLTSGTTWHAAGLVSQLGPSAAVTKIRKYTLDLNSRKIYFENKSLNLTEKESDLILFINSSKRAELKKIQKIVWGYSSDLETHTVETHIYRLRKKMLKNFKDQDFIKHDQDGYYLS